MITGADLFSVASVDIPIVHITSSFDFGLSAGSLILTLGTILVQIFLYRLKKFLLCSVGKNLNYQNSRTYFNYKILLFYSDESSLISTALFLYRALFKKTENLTKSEFLNNSFSNNYINSCHNNYFSFIFI